MLSGFGDLVVSVLASGTQDRVQTRPKPSDFSGEKNPQHAFLQRGSKAVCPMSQFAACLRALEITWKSNFQAKFVGHFKPISVPRYQRAVVSLDVERLWGRRAELKAVHKGPASLQPRCDGVVAP